MKNHRIGYSADDRRSLIKRYLLWLYRMTKEELEKIERKFTQLEVDCDIQKTLQRQAHGLDEAGRQDIAPHLKEWQEYIAQKESDARKLKFIAAERLHPQYLFLRMKLKAVEDITIARFGKKTLADFKKICHEAAVQRILQDVPGRR